jgi:endogenous inhibitor of DNA gyrase (YacG/DUF329 family)
MDKMFADIFRWLQSRFMMPWVVVYINCPYCGQMVEWYLNDTEYIERLHFARECPACGLDIRVAVV